jgi:hypothetical protein
MSLSKSIMKLRFVPLVSLALISAPFLSAGDIILHPNGFGPHSYAAWKAQAGLPDTAGNKNQALYFQKMTSTTTVAAGVAVFQGIEGMPVSALTGLEFWIATGDGSHCGAGAPRFDLRVKPTVGPSTTYFFGCAAMVPDPVVMTAPSGRIYEKRTVAAPALAAAQALGGTITGLEIVFDEGDDVGTGFAYLDNISITINGAPMVWTSASDNGGQL